MFRFLLITSIFLASLSAHSSGWIGTRPKLVVVIVIDQFRSDYLSRFRTSFRKDGFAELIREGAYYPVAEYDVLQAMTGPGHATILTGAYPYKMGVPINSWYNQSTHAEEYCVQDSAVKTIGLEKSSKPSVSPKNLIGSTFGDELKSSGLSSRVVAIAIKDRAAILLGGKRADLALWVEDGKWTTSTYYQKDGKLSNWVDRLILPRSKRLVIGRRCAELSKRLARSKLHW